MLKRIALFYKLIAILSILGTFLIMGSSLNPIVTFTLGILGALIFMSIAVTLEIISGHLEYQTKAVKWLVKSRRDGRRN